MTEVSIIIPTYNESTYLPQTLERLSKLAPSACEIIVVDSSNTDETEKVVRKYSVRFQKTSIAQRSTQMNLGAQIAQNPYLCFLHADTLVPKDFVKVIQHTLQDDRIALAGFTSLMKGKRIRWMPTFLNYLKTYLAPLVYRPHRFLFRGLRLLFGDQVLFCRRTDFLHCGGFDPELPIMEEADLCLKMNKLGSIKQIKRTVISSDRRLVQWGLLKAHVIWLGICVLWSVQVSPKWLKKFYEEVR